MPSARACPPAPDLQRLLRGELAPPAADGLERHVEGCAACQQALQTLDRPDGLVETARAVAARAPATPPASLEGLIERLARLPGGSSRTLPTVAGAASSSDTDLDLAALLAPPQGPGEIGRLGTYRILGVLGQGGMGIVFRAEDVRLGRLVALKVINPRLAANALARERFVREARSAAALDHDHIVPLYHVGEDGGVPYLAFPLLKGESLEDRLRRLGQLPPPEVVRIGREVAEGLAAAHAQGLIHRDVKPANIWLEGEPGASATGGRVKILDFGLARAVTEARDGRSQAADPRGTEGAEGPTRPQDLPSLTQTGAVFGTPAYMAPEQARGEPVDHRADLFSLGAVLYRMTTGRLPFAGTDLTAVLASLERDRPTPPRSLDRRLPARLSKLIEQLLAKSAAERPASARAVAEALAGIPAAGRRGPRALAAVALGALACGAVLWAVLPQNGGRRAGHPAGTGVEEDEPVRDLEAHYPAAWRVAFSADDKLAISCGEDNLVRVSDVATGKVLQRLKGHTAGVISLAMHPDSRHLVTGGRDRTIRVWDLTTAREVRQFQGVTDNCWDLSISPDGTRVAGSSERNGFRVWAFASGRLQDSFPGYWTNALAFAPGGARVLAGGADGRPRLWDLKQKKPLLTLQGHRSWIRAVSFNRDGTLAATGSSEDNPGADRSVRLWDMTSGRELFCFRGQDHCVFSPDCCFLLTSNSPQKTLHVWDVATRQQKLRLDAPPDVTTVALSANGKYALAGGFRGHVRLWPLRPGERVGREPRRFTPLVEERVLDTLPGLVRQVAFSPDGRRAYAVAGDGSVACWEVRTGRRLFTGKHEAAALTLALSRDGKYLITSGYDHTVRCWDAVRGTELRRFENPPTHGSWCVAASPTSDLVVGGIRKESWVWDIDTGKCVARRPANGSGLAFLRDRPAFLAGDENALRLCPLAPDQPLGTWGSSLGWVRRVVVSADGRYAATGHGNAGDHPRLLNDDYSVRLWDVKAGRLLKRFDGFSWTVWGLAFTPDSKRLFAAGLDGSLHLYDVEGLQETWRKEIWRKEGLVPLFDIAVSPDGRSVLTGDRLGRVHLWKVVGTPAAEADAGRARGWIASVAALPPRERVEAVAARLKELNPAFHGQLTPTTEGGVITRLAFHSAGVTDLAPLRALPALEDLAIDATMDVRGDLADLTPLRGLRLKHLGLSWTGVYDLTPLRGMPLENLSVHVTPVKDLTPLHGLPLKNLGIGYTRVRDLGPLKGLPLEVLDCRGLAVSDWSPLKALPLKELWISDPAGHAELLRSIKGLRWVNGRPAAEAWKEGNR